MSEQQLITILTGNRMAQPTRPEQEARSTPRMLRHNMPLSSGPSRSAAPAVELVRQATVTTPSSLDRVNQTIGLITQFRQAQREERHGQSRVTSEPDDMEQDGGESQMADPAVPTPAVVAPAVPVIYEGMDESCSICQEAFNHGQRVCRLSCRHMFHAACWERAQHSHNATAGQPTLGCPNCRGAGTIIAVWDYIDPERVTQVIGGLPAPNLLESSASFHSLVTPPSGAVTPRSARSVTGSVRGESQMAAPSTYYAGTHAFHIQTRLPDGRPALIVDPGSVGNLCGDKWAKEVAIAASRSGHRPSYERRSRPLSVSGVGHGSQTCHFDCKLPVSLRHAGGQSTSFGELTIPAVERSEMPGLLGKMALRRNRAVWDFVTDKLYFLGPGDYDLERALPPGTDVYQLEQAPSGHSVLPCCEYSSSSGGVTEHTLTLMSRNHIAAARGDPSSPPINPPVLPDTARRAEVLSPPPAGEPTTSL